MRAAGRLVVEPWMTHERLDDQVMMINLETGAYFALERPAADCWSALSDGAGVDGIVAEVVAGFEVAPERARVDVEAFLATLVDEGIVRWATDAPADVAPGGPAPDPAGDGTGAAPAGARGPYRPPQIEKHDDLEELLLLDPIHDVGPEGWPAAG
jgi:hypothetical protein